MEVSLRDVSSGPTEMRVCGRRKHTFFNHWRSSCSVQLSGSVAVSTVGGENGGE